MPKFKVTVEKTLRYTVDDVEAPTRAEAEVIAQRMVDANEAVYFDYVAGSSCTSKQKPES